MKIALIDDHKLFLAGIKMVIEQYTDFDVETFSEFNEEIYIKILNANPDMVICDINLPSVSGIEILKFLKKTNPKIKVVILTVREDQHTILVAKQEKADAFLSKNIDPETLISTLHQVFQQENGFLIANISAFSEGKLSIQALTNRELEVLSLLCQGFSVKEVAAKLYVSNSTIISHKKNLFAKTKTKSLVELTKHAVLNGLVVFD